MLALTRFFRARLSPEGYLGLHLTLGALLLVAASAIFGAIAEDVSTAAAITLLDVRIAQWLHGHATPTVTSVMLIVSTINGIAGIIVLSIGLACYLWRRRAWYWMLSVLIAVAGGTLLNVAMKYAFHRARPSFDDPLLTLTTYSFPSGHTAGSTVFYGVLSCYLFSRYHTWPARCLIATLATMMVALVGSSRMYLGVHYFSDVAGAIAEGIAWLALSVTAVSTLRRRRAYYPSPPARALHG